MLDEWDARCHQQRGTQPAGYLFGIIQKAIHGSSRPGLGEGGSPSTPPAAVTATSSHATLHDSALRRAAWPRGAQTYLASSRSTLGGDS